MKKDHFYKIQKVSKLLNQGYKILKIIHRTQNQCPQGRAGSTPAAGIGY